MVRKRGEQRRNMRDTALFGCPFCSQPTYVPGPETGFRHKEHEEHWRHAGSGHEDSALNAQQHHIVTILYSKGLM